MLYGTLNHIQSIYSDINQIEIYLKQTLTPIMEYVFNENRSIKNLFSAIDYAPMKKNDGRSLLHIKHLLNHLESRHGIKAGFFSYEKRILYSTIDVETTFYLQTLLGLEHNLPLNEIYMRLNPENKLKSGVSLIRIYIRRPPSLQPILNAINTNTTYHANSQIQSHPINIINSLLSSENELSPIQFHSTDMSYPLSTSDKNRYKSILEQQSTSSSGETTDFDCDQIRRISSTSSVDTNSVRSSFNDKKFIPIPQFSKEESSLIYSPTSPNGLGINKDKIDNQYKRTRSILTDNDYTNSLKIDPDISRTDDTNITRLVFEQIENDDYESACREEDMICLPPMSLFSNYYRGRQRTLTSHSDLDDPEYNNNRNQEGHAKWGDVPSQNDEIERDEYILYIQRNSRMLFAGIIEKNLITEKYLQNLWCLMLTEMADMDREIQIIPISGETSKYSTDIKFQFNENIRQTQFERFSVGNHSYYKTPSSDSACMAFNARTKLSLNPERRIIALSRGNNLISINRTLPDRVTYSCRRLHESK
ncbi:unnamed protein product [Adineta steineri]|uniref:Uncharacterized protein n=1 Tax=Adineta steineri TaxID=433720 RepID=A0A819TXD6_9BILA|nr:unnamed protein product [Adineta steineri]